MGRTLMILEVSRKQDYIFSSKQLRENAIRSEDISRVTGSHFFREVAGELYREEENLVYSGGGHTVLQFSDQDTAVRFARTVSAAAMRQYDGMELFIKQIPYAGEKLPSENLKALTEALEAKKALRKSSFRQMSFGVERLDPADYTALQVKDKDIRRPAEHLPPPEGWQFPNLFSVLAGEDPFIAVVHVDGNAMGKRVQKLYERSGGADWETCRRSLQRFSSGIQADFERAFQKTVETLLREWPELKKQAFQKAVEALDREEPELKKLELPIRPVILAGDDVCFVTAGSLGLECARVFLEELTKMKNQEDGLPYAACAGVALVHQKYPFHQAYDLAEELCSSAKRFGAELDEEGRVCAMDWHIEFGQIKGTLAQSRVDYETEDGNRLELRPVVVAAPQDVPLEKIGVRTYDFFRGMCRAMQGEYGKTARSKIKDLRTAFKQGVVESRFFLREKEISDLLYHVFLAKYPTEQARMEQYRKMLEEKGAIHKEPFEEIGGVRRCLFFDSIELIDHCTFLEEVEV